MVFTARSAVDETTLLECADEEAEDLTRQKLRNLTTRAPAKTKCFYVLLMVLTRRIGVPQSTSTHTIFVLSLTRVLSVMSCPSPHTSEYRAKLSQNPKQLRLVAFGGHRLKSCGKATLLCEHKNKYWPVEFEVLEDVTNVLGLKTCEELQLVKQVETLSDDVLGRYADTFTGLGCITGVTHHIQLDSKHEPVVHPPRKVPVTIRSKVKEELQRMERLEVIERVHEPTDWVNSMVTVVNPNGKLRIFIDPRDLNKAIKREHYPMKTIEEIAARMPNATIFSVLDASSGFWQVKLDTSSSNLCIFNTPFGHYMFKRLPFGISSAQDVFQAIMSEMFEDIEGVEVISSFGAQLLRNTMPDLSKS